MSRIVCLVALVLVSAGCGGATRGQQPAERGIPGALAHGWAGRASAIAAAAAAGDDCRATQLADSLRDDVLAQEHELPLRLRSSLVAGVNALADRLSCTRTVTMGTPPGPPPHKPKPPHEPHGHGHSHGHGHGHGGDG